MIDNKKTTNSRQHSFAERLDALLMSDRGKAKELADYCNTSPQAVSKWRLGITSPSVDKIPLIAKCLGVSTDYLFGLTDTPSTNTSVKAVSNYLGLSSKAIDTIKRICFRYAKGSYLHCYIEPLGFEIESIYQKPIEALNTVLENYYFVEELCIYLLAPPVRRIEGASYYGDLTFELLHSLMNDLQGMRETFQRSLGAKLRDIYDEYTDTYIDDFEEPVDIEKELDDFDNDDIEF